MPGVVAPTRIKLDSILFATDFSPSAETALSYALNLAHHYNGSVYSVNVLPHMPFIECPQVASEQARFLMEERMAEFSASPFLRDIRHKEFIEEGEVAEVLSRLAAEHDIHLIVLGTGGRKGFGKLLLGSVAEEVFRKAECPVLTVGPHATRWEIEGHLRHILYATDFGAESLHALPYAVSLSEENHARLTMLHVALMPDVPMTEIEAGAMRVYDRDEISAERLRHLRSLIPEANQLRQEPEYLVEFGSPVGTILKAAATADLIVLGVKRPTVLTKHLGAGVAYKVACDAPCPVLSVSARCRD